MKSVSDLFRTFSGQWPRDRKGFRSDEDESWKAYATTLRDLVSTGDAGEVSQELRHENSQVRALAARALGFINDANSVPGLSKVIMEDQWATARLLAADSLGMINTPDARSALHEASQTEENKDVVLHAEIALSRSSGLEARALEDLKSIEETSLGIAASGKVAPDFSLPTSDDREIILSGYKDERPVALYFLYGDG